MEGSDQAEGIEETPLFYLCQRFAHIFGKHQGLITCIHKEIITMSGDKQKL